MKKTGIKLFKENLGVLLTFVYVNHTHIKLILFIVIITFGNPLKFAQQRNRWVYYMDELPMC